MSDQARVQYPPYISDNGMANAKITELYLLTLTQSHNLAVACKAKNDALEAKNKAEERLSQVSTDLIRANFKRRLKRPKAIPTAIVAGEPIEAPTEVQ
jgi:hypothetical protein